MNPIEQELFRKAAADGRAIYGNFELTPLCNCHCDMCFVTLSRVEMESKGRLLTAQEWINIARDAAQEGVLFVQLTGGEPLLHDGFRDIYAELKHLGIVITINTNGTLIDESWADFFAENPPRRLNITLYGASNETYEILCHIKNGFDKTLRAIRLLRERGVAVKLNSTVVRKNAADRLRLIDVARSLGVPIDTETYIMPGSRERQNGFCQESRLEAEDAAQAMIDVIEKDAGTMGLARYFMQTALLSHSECEGEWHREVPHKDASGRLPMRCNGGRCAFIVNWQGQLRPCIMMNVPSVSIIRNGFAAAWETIKRETARIRVAAECSGCPLVEVCKVCPAASLLESGSLDMRPEYLCRYTRRQEAIRKQFIESQ